MNENKAIYLDFYINKCIDNESLCKSIAELLGITNLDILIEDINHFLYCTKKRAKVLKVIGYTQIYEGDFEQGVSLTIYIQHKLLDKYLFLLKLSELLNIQILIGDNTSNPYSFILINTDNTINNISIQDNEDSAINLTDKYKSLLKTN